MAIRVGLLFLFTLYWASDARELARNSLSSGVVADVSVLQINHQQSGQEIQVSKEVGRKEEVCKMCEMFAMDAVQYLAQNKTQTEVIDVLHKACSRMLSFKQQCITLVDYYAPLFFLEIETVQPEEFCKKVNLCEEMVITSEVLSQDSCEICHHTVEEILSKLKDPDTQLDIIEVLLKGCDAVEKYKKKCKRLVFQYGPLILANAEQYLEKTDLCTALHACTSPNAGNKQESSIVNAPMVADA